LKDTKDSALSVSLGCSAPPPPPKKMRVSARRPVLSRQNYLDGILDGDRSILARAITLIESSRAEDRQLAEQIIEDCLPHSGQSIRVGITGVPGAGKSSLIEALGAFLIQNHNQKIAILAIDPSSQLSGGSVLGDKTRMASLSSSEMAFIRPSPSRGFLGGVAQHTREAILLCEAAGYKNIIVETIGTGQSETAVHDMVDCFLLIALAGAGDELQGIKRGVMEFADVVAINKADGDNLPAAKIAQAQAQNALHYLLASSSGWTPRAVTCSAHTGQGISELWGCVSEYSALTNANGWLKLHRQAQTRTWMREIIQQQLRQQFESHPAIRENITQFEHEVAAGRTTSFCAARTLLDMYSHSATHISPQATDEK
jgi:LAO/AO transport system kinase